MSQAAQPVANPLGLNGVDFVEYTGRDAKHFENLFTKWGFKEVGNVPGKEIRLFRQGEINFIVNTEPGSFAAEFAKIHGSSVSSTGFRFQDANKAYEMAIARGARAFKGTDSEKGAAPFPAIYGIGDSLIYFMDDKNSQKLYNDIFRVKPEDASPKGVGFTIVDHFTNNVPKGQMQLWCDFYNSVFNFQQTLYFDIRGKETGLLSQVMRSPCGTFAVPINEPGGGKNQIQEYLDEYKGSGIQHVALLTPNIVETLENLRSSELEFLSAPPDTYYRMLKDRLPQVSEDLERLKKNAILVDGDHDGYLLQIFSKNIIGPIFFELIQRKGHDGFGNGNFQALFDAIEQDQRERGYL